ncbi:MAG: SHOCT domain-containing protein, partial [Actinomycetes bacterium]
ALPMLNQMRAKIGETKRPTVVMNAPPPTGGGLAEEIGKLAVLRDQGILTEQEFQTAKQGTIARGVGS